MIFRARLRLVALGVTVLGGVAFAACGGSSGDGVSGGDTEGGTAPNVEGGGPGSEGGSMVDSPGPKPDNDSGARNVPAGGACTMDSDCVSGGCDYTLHCAISRSCKTHNGGDTCGPNGKESCCTTIAVPRPGAAYKLDKYNVTSGRFRVFIESTKGDVRGYVQAHRPAWFEPVWDTWLPNKMDDGTVVDVNVGIYAPGQGQDGVYQQLGPIHYGAKEAGGNEGCSTSQVGNARTYRLPDATNTALFSDAQQYAQDILDQKPQQCTTFFMLAAFCIWDGGSLPTLAELDFAWNKGQSANYLYPWGNAPAEGGFKVAEPTNPGPAPYNTIYSGESVTPPGGDPTYANWQYNFWQPASMQCIGDDPAKCDYSVFVAPPGSFPKGNGPFGHADLAGNVFNVALPMSGAAGSDPTTRTVVLSRSGSWEVHKAPYYLFGMTRAWKPFNKYLGTGVRCLR